MNADQDNLAGLLMGKWRTNYLTNPLRCFHSVDFFEEVTPNYKKRELRMTRRFNKATLNLLDIIGLIDFTAEVFYIDLEKIRAKYRIGQPPKVPLQSATHTEKVAYRKNLKMYRQLVSTQMGKKTEYYPLTLALFRSFKKHSQSLQANPSSKGCINFESLGTLDGRYVDIYHKYATSDQNYRYGNEIIGMNLHTKASTNGGGIEIADLISYISTQTLRSEHRLKHELVGITAPKLKQIQVIRDVMRDKFKIKLVDITKDAI